MKMKYGGPDNGRPTLTENQLGAAAAKKYRRRPRVTGRTVAEVPGEKGRHYLSRRRKSRA